MRRLEQSLIETFRKAGVDSPGLSARLILEHVTGLSRLELALDRALTASPAQAKQIGALAERITRGEPLAHVIGERGFYEHTFAVNRHVLIPRPETEQLVDIALERLPTTRVVFADLGCGSGCIGLSLLAMRPQWEGVLVDISSPALEVCARNARRIAPRAQLLQGSIFEMPLQGKKFDLIVSNPPYIARGDEVMAQVLAFEPHSALFSDNAGLAHLSAVVKQAGVLLKPGGLIVLEHGSAQQADVVAMLEKRGFVRIVPRRDLAGLERSVEAYLQE